MPACHEFEFQGETFFIFLLQDFCCFSQILFTHGNSPIFSPVSRSTGNQLVTYIIYSHYLVLNVLYICADSNINVTDINVVATDDVTVINVTDNNVTVINVTDINVVVIRSE